MELVVAGALSFCLDLLLGDPGWIPHPVVWMGRAKRWSRSEVNESSRSRFIFTIDT